MCICATISLVLPSGNLHTYLPVSFLIELTTVPIPNLVDDEVICKAFLGYNLCEFP